MRYRRALAEAIGTFFLVLIGPGAAMGIAFVTLAFWSVRRFPASEVFPSVLAQCIGASAASAVLRTALGPVVGFKEPSWNPPVTAIRAAE
jgi:glycerol uptake facilitator-like aquaporin